MAESRAMMNLNLEWKIIDGNRVALIFDTPSWRAFQTTADARGVDTSDMITEALVKLLSPIIAAPS
jgi:hypothetical protein